MFNKFTIFLAALVLAITGIAIGSSGPAAAYDTGKKCVTRSAVTTCVEPHWRTQGDGTGVYIEGFWIDTTNGCSDLESSGGRYNPVTAFTANPQTGVIWDSWDFGAEDCNFYKDIEAWGKDKGSFNFRGTLKARVDWGSDHKVYWGFKLSPNGSYDLEYLFTEDQ